MTKRFQIRYQSLFSLGWILIAFQTMVTSLATAQQADKLEATNRFPRMMQDWLVGEVRARRHERVNREPAFRASINYRPDMHPIIKMATR